MFKKKKLFGNNILSSCDYCDNAGINEDGKHICELDKIQVKKGNNCRKFKYNPLKRTPVTGSIRLPEYKPEDFIL